MNNQALIFILVLVQNVIIVTYLNFVLDFKWEKKVTNIVLYVFLNCLFLATTPIINLKPLKLAIITISQTVMFKIVSKNTWWETIKKSLMLVVLTMLTEIISDVIYYGISYANNSRLDIDNASAFDTLRVLSSSFNLSIFMSIILIYSLNYQKTLIKIKRKLTFILVMIPLVMVFVHYVVYSYNVTTFTKTTLLFVYVSTIIFTFLSLAIYRLMMQVDLYAKNELELDFLKQKEKMQLEYYKMMQSKEEEIRKINHDIKNNLQVIYSLKSEEEKTKLINKIDNNLRKYELVKYSKNDIQNIILNMKVNDAKFKGINIDIMLKNSLDFVDDLDISNLFSNILDNAIENASKSDKKKIDFLIIKKMNYIVVKCSNTYDGVMFFDKEKQIKTKKDNNHGYGLKIIDSIVKKYQGDKKITIKDDLFTIMVMLPVRD